MSLGLVDSIQLQTKASMVSSNMANAEHFQLFMFRFKSHVATFKLASRTFVADDEQMPPFTFTTRQSLERTNMIEYAK